MGIKIIFSSKKGPDWVGPGFQSPTHLKPILILKSPYPARPLSDPLNTLIDYNSEPGEI